jgi:hypothetical protein
VLVQALHQQQTAVLQLPPHKDRENG